MRPNKDIPIFTTPLFENRLILNNFNFYKMSYYNPLMIYGNSFVKK